MPTVVLIRFACCAPPPREALSDAAIRLSVRLSVCPIQRLCQANRAVRNADPSARGRRSAAIGMEGDIVLPCDSLFFIAFVMLFCAYLPLPCKAVK